MKPSIFFLLNILMIFSGNSQTSLDRLLARHNSGDIPYISVEELRMNQLDNEVIILDAREKEEYSVSHIENSIFIGYQDFNISVLEGFSKDEKFVVYCSLGIRSARIGKILQKEGFENVQNLYGGIFEWKKKGYPVIDS